MGDWQNSPTFQAAAMEGISENLAFPMFDRLTAAQQANALLRKHIEDLESTLKSARDASADLCVGCSEWFDRYAFGDGEESDNA